jgi:propanol-preferring alcohol dehydrogenase
MKMTMKAAVVCSYCWSGWETLCERQKNTGYSVNGAFAEYVVADANYIGHLPSNVDFVQIAPILCARVTVYKGLKVSGTRPGDWVVISGARQDREVRSKGRP